MTWCQAAKSNPLPQRQNPSHPADHVSTKRHQPQYVIEDRSILAEVEIFDGYEKPSLP
jgi:hypothetical protein